jgi:hypothetical protein
MASRSIKAIAARALREVGTTLQAEGGVEVRLHIPLLVEEVNLPWWIALCISTGGFPIGVSFI